jgi:S-adenosylmethionine hydrolase
VSRIVALLSDFGTRDGYVGAMKGVLLSRCAGARIVDVTHEIPPGDVTAGAFALAQAAEWFPPGSVFLCVVDPGVGSQRRAIACAIGPRLYVAPDNGLLSRLLERGDAVSAHGLTRPELWLPSVSEVFHGRDLFAPVAAHLASGGALADVGPALSPASLVRAPWPEPRLGADGGEGCVVYVDHFGNLISNLPVGAGAQEARGVAVVADREVPLRRTYADVAAGEPVALRGSSGLLEIALNLGNAAEALGARRGDVVTWRRPPQE